MQKDISYISIIIIHNRLSWIMEGTSNTDRPKNQFNLQTANKQFGGSNGSFIRLMELKKGNNHLTV